MNHKEVYKKFEVLLPLYCCGSLKWYADGKNAIRIVVMKGLEFIFTFHNNSCWSFETIKSHEKYRFKE